MSQAILSLRAAVHAVLTGDATLLALLGGPRLHDEPPRAAKGLYAVFGAASADNGTGLDAPMVSHRFEIDLWGPHSGGTARALEAAGRIVTLLDGSPAALSWLGGVRGQRVSPLGIDRFGQTGDLPDLYRTYRLDADAVVEAMAELLLP